MSNTQRTKAAQQRNHPEKPDLAIGKLRNPVERITPLFWEQEWNDTFKQQH